MVCVKESAKRSSAASQTLTDFVGVALRDYARNQKEKTTVGDLLFLAPPAGLEPATSYSGLFYLSKNINNIASFQNACGYRRLVTTVTRFPTAAHKSSPASSATGGAAVCYRADFLKHSRISRLDALLTLAVRCSLF